MDRETLSRRIAEGVAGWMQFTAAQNLADHYGEDSLQLAMVHILHAQGQWRVEVSANPWPATGYRGRVDAALWPFQDAPATSYGFIEVKMPTANSADVRLDIVQDVVRVARAPTANLNAHLLVIAVARNVAGSMWAGPDFDALLPRSLAITGDRSLADLNRAFPDHSSRVPPGQALDRGLSTQLLATAEVRHDGTTSADVHVWQCNLRPGPPPAAPPPAPGTPGP